MATILVVEDSEPIRTNIVELLEAEGYVAAAAVNGEEGWRITRELKPDLVVSDIMMPELDGPGLLARLRADEETEHIPLIFLTARTSKSDAREGMNLGADDYIPKPYDIDELLRSVETRLRLRGTVRRRAESDAREREERRFRALVENGSDGALVLSETGAIRYASPPSGALLGADADELIGASLFDLVEDQDGDVARVLAFAAEHEGETRIVEANVARGEEERRIEIAVTGRFRTDGVEGAAANIRDVTERRRYVENLKRAKEEAERMNVIKSNFLANISHELRTPLNGILGFAQILKEDLANLEQRSMAESVEISAKRLANTLNSILDLSLVESKEVKFVETEVDVEETIEAAVRRHKKIAEEKGLRLLSEARRPGAIIKGEQRFLSQIVSHLIDNAIKFTTEGGVTVSWSVEDIDGERRCLVRVADTGIGVAPENHELIFNEFRQVSEGRSRHYEGSGVGLTIARKMARWMNGDVTVESRLGEGAVFTLSLLGDVDDDRNQDMTEKDFVIEETDEPPLVLLVEDNRINEEITELFLRRVCRLDYARNGERAIELAREKKYATILMDINLGAGIDGVEAARVIRSETENVETPIVAMTGYAMFGDREKFLSLGFARHLPKPFSREQVVELVGELIADVRQPA
ncbi:MAG: response regulator [Ignavibacteriales bacterium]|nr:response regulator [Ignavibacteriales bacterium]